MIQPSTRRLVALLSIGVLSAAGPGTHPAPALGQAPTAAEAELPGPGVLWLETAPILESWSDQFAVGSDSLADGSREPLHADYGGPLTERLYPGPGPLAEAVNRGADSLGFAPMAPGEVSLGSLEFGSISSRRTTLPIRALVGVTERIALDVGVSFVQTRTDVSFRYDSSGATLAPADLALEDGSGYLDGLASARSALRDRLAGGELPPDREEAARALLARSGAFAAVLDRRLGAGGLLPLAGSRPGAEMAAFAADLRSSFQAFGLQVPELGLSSAPGGETLERVLTGPLVDAEPLRGSAIGLQPAELDLGLRVGLVDTFRPGGEAGDGTPSRGGLALRTTAGLRLRWPLAEPDRAPFHTPSRFLDTPAGPGARVVEAAVYQDAAYGIVEASAAAGFGLTLADEPTLRVHDPSRPLALAAARTALRREPGDYVWITFSPRVAVNPYLSMGAEYAYWQEGESGFSRFGAAGDGEGGSGAIDPAALERETSARRHSAGISVRYTAGAPADSDGPGPVEAAFTYRLAVTGAGGQTPASNVMGVRIRVPVSVGLF